MAYDPNTDFMGLLRQTGGGVRAERVPGLDYIVAALARAGMIALVVGSIAPTENQITTAWLRPGIPAWAFEGTLFLWNVNTGQYEFATPELWAAFFIAGSTAKVVQDITDAGPVVVQTNATIVRVQNVGVAVSLTMPLSADMVDDVLITDWANHAGTNNITVTLSGGDVFPGGGNEWTIAADAGSIFLRPVPGGFAL